MIFYAYTVYEPKDPDVKRREAMAQATWRNLPWTPIPISDSDLPRMCREEDRAWPYIVDIMNHAVKGLPDLTIVCYLNSDIHVRNDVCDVVEGSLKKTHAVYCHRRDFHRPITEPLKYEDFHNAHYYAGSDFYAFHAGWWRRYGHIFPNKAIAGAEGWDPCMRLLINETNPHKKNEVFDLIAHERHSGIHHWEHSGNRYRWKCQKEALRCIHRWMLDRGHNPAQYGIQLPPND